MVVMINLACQSQLRAQLSVVFGIVCSIGTGRLVCNKKSELTESVLGILSHTKMTQPGPNILLGKLAEQSHKFKLGLVLVI